MRDSGMSGIVQCIINGNKVLSGGRVIGESA